MLRTLYDILGVRSNASFEDLKKAYYARAKQCHPDLNPDKPGATEDFQRLVNAFDILSNPDTRRKYDEQRTFANMQLPDSNPFHEQQKHVMDTIADDILEELVVGNNISPFQTTLQNLMLDLAKTTHFIMFREARNAYTARRYAHCLRLCSKLVSLSPQNILYHFTLAEAARHLGRDFLAIRHYRRCLLIGAQRMPPQRLLKVRTHYSALLKRQGWFGKLLAWISGTPPPRELSEQEKMQNHMDAFFSRALKKPRNRPAIVSDSQRRLLKPPQKH